MPAARPCIYQLYLRQFSNIRSPSQPHGSLARNGVGKFADLNPAALNSLRNLGVTHLWLLGVLRQATGTPYPDLQLPADDPDLLKGVAGSPFAVRDVFDVCPDYARDPARRLDEFRELISRIHQHHLRVIIDFIPNHVARSHRSVVRPDLEWGSRDDPTQFFAPQNNFFHLTGQGPLVLPTVVDGQPVTDACRLLGGCDGRFDPESVQARVTGNNVTSAHPGLGDWYETVKLNYGYDFTRGRHAPRLHPTREDPDQPIPDTWLQMDAVLAHWQALGVDGFRCDMAHWIPMEFWDWAIHRARLRNPEVFLVAEAYEDDPSKVTDHNVLIALLDAGFDAVYDDLTYDLIKAVFDGPKWANDLDDVLGRVAPLHRSLRYAENHDEVRIAHPKHWGGHGPQVGIPASALLLGIGRGPILLHNGQEVGEPALDPLNPKSAHARTSLFDYGHMPELRRWVNQHRYDGGALSPQQQALREAYQCLLNALQQPAFAHGEFHPLNPHHIHDPGFGRFPGDPASGHWVYAWIRHDPVSGQWVLCVVNLHPTLSLTSLRIRIPAQFPEPIGSATGRIRLTDLLGTIPDILPEWPRQTPGMGEVRIPELPALSAIYLEPVPGVPKPLIATS